MKTRNFYLQVLNIAGFNLILIGIFFSGTSTFAASSEKGEKFKPGEMIMHHIVDDHSWHLFDYEGHTVSIPLPIIVYSSVKGLDLFLSSKFYDNEHNSVAFKGYEYHDNHITLADSEASVYDFSITKNVAALLGNSIIIFCVFAAVARGFRKNEGKAPKGIQSLFEPIIIFVRDEIVKDSIGPKYERFLPYMLSLFFFIWFGNLLGLLPGAANLTGNIAVTMVLALFTFILTNVNGKKTYWSHIFIAPGVPMLLKPLIVLVEIIGVFTKPFSLMIRLFVAITAGHIVILSLISLTFIFSSFFVGIGSTLIVIFINLIEILVASIQAYVFTLFSALYIGMALEEAH